MKFSLSVALSLAAVASARTFYETNTHFITVDADGNIVGGQPPASSAEADAEPSPQANNQFQQEPQVTQAFVTSLGLGSTTSSPPAQSPSSSSSAPSSSAGGDNVSGFDKQILDAHNSKRAKHSAPALSWSDELASYAQNMADKYTCGSSLQHSGGKYGENLAVGYDGAEGTVKAWYDEGSNYDYSSASSFNHFTQVIWKGSKQLGCAQKQCDNGGPYVVCEYYPAGNMIGQGEQNLAAN
ncbi:hypothetical protein FDK38_004234 [Candidozyma auris]|nr:hypothetical protein FDK38_004234 [[Candida] auris]